MNSKTVNISGKEVTLTASAATPRWYRACFKRDILKDLKLLEAEIAKGEEIPSMELFENIAFIMAGVPQRTPAKTIDEWLSEFDTFDIYNAIPVIFELWGLNMETLEEGKKKDQSSESSQPPCSSSDA